MDDVKKTVKLEWSEFREELFFMVAVSNKGRLSLSERSTWESQWYELKPQVRHLSFIEYALQLANAAEVRRTGQDSEFTLKVPERFPGVMPHDLKLTVVGSIRLRDEYSAVGTLPVEEAHW